MKKSKSILLFLLSALTSLQFASAQNGGSKIDNQLSVSKVVNTEVKSRIDSTLESLVQENSIAGVSALIFEKDKEVYYNAFGYADREAEIKMDRNTVVRIFSMTKPIT